MRPRIPLSRSLSDGARGNVYVASHTETNKYRLLHVERVPDGNTEVYDDSWLYAFRKYGFVEYVGIMKQHTNLLLSALLYLRHVKDMSSVCDALNYVNLYDTVKDSTDEHISATMRGGYRNFSVWSPMLLAVVVCALVVLAFRPDAVLGVSFSAFFITLTAIVWKFTVADEVERLRQDKSSVFFFASNQNGVPLSDTYNRVSMSHDAQLGYHFKCYFKLFPGGTSLGHSVTLNFVSVPYTCPRTTNDTMTAKWANTEMFAGLAAASNAKIDSMCDVMFDVQSVKKYNEFADTAIFQESSQQLRTNAQSLSRIDLSSMLLSASCDRMWSLHAATSA